VQKLQARHQQIGRLSRVSKNFTSGYTNHLQWLLQRGQNTHSSPGRLRDEPAAGEFLDGGLTKAAARLVALDTFSRSSLPKRVREHLEESPKSIS
jgi:hypothetical protein